MSIALGDSLDDNHFQFSLFTSVQSFNLYMCFYFQERNPSAQKNQQ